MDPTTLAGFFIATAIGMANLHMGLVRLIASSDKTENQEHLGREARGSLIVLEFAGVVVLCSLVLLLSRGRIGAGGDQFAAASWLAPIVALLVVIANGTFKPGSDAYYVVTALLVGGCNLFLLVFNRTFDVFSNAQTFVTAVGSCLLVIAAQVYKTAIRFVAAKARPRS